MTPPRNTNPVSVLPSSTGPFEINMFYTGGENPSIATTQDMALAIAQCLQDGLDLARKAERPLICLRDVEYIPQPETKNKFPAYIIRDGENIVGYVRYTP